jgi:lipoprotein-anchoring transpeptidase ErfK/SrfK
MTSDISQIVISRSSQTITALRSGSTPQVFKAEGAQVLPQGSFSITLKEDKPLWYAPNEYFTKRSLPVPEQGSRSRFMRAALGQRALYLNDQTPIHSGPVWLREIGGLRLKSSDMDQLYSMITVGTRVEIR